MKISIQKAKNGEDTALADGHFLHSNYAPVKEAQRFAENLTLPFKAEKLIILEPALSYAADYIRARFPDLKIGAVRYEKAFAQFNSKFDFVLNYYEHEDFTSYLEQIFNEEELLSTCFISWPASAQVYKDIEKNIWISLKSAMERAKTLLITRQYFEKKWLFNTFRFLSNVKHTVSFEGLIEKDILIISSGPSLIPFIDIIHKYQNNFFIICLSSAISLCQKYNIKADLYMTTDGGYWAGQHLKKITQTNIPLAMPAEAFCNIDLLHKANILPLIYGDGISKELTLKSGITFKKAVRNGTVSGTALLFAAQYSTKNIYFSGLDLACQKGFQHTQPNELEINNSIFDNRIKNKNTRLIRSELTNGSLDIYRDWFISNNLNLKNRSVYRLIEKDSAMNNLQWIKDLSLKDFSLHLKNETEEKENIFFKTNYQFDPESFSSLLNNSEKIEHWKHQLFPLDYVSLSHNIDNKEIKDKIDDEWKKLKIKISGLLNENI